MTFYDAWIDEVEGWRDEFSDVSPEPWKKSEKKRAKLASNVSTTVTVEVVPDKATSVPAGQVKLV